MTDQPFLIAHKVRNEPAFDIAIKQPCALCDNGAVHDDPEVPGAMVACDECDGEGYWWICSTSGHRAYPYWHVELFDIDCGLDIESLRMPDGLPDHYPSSASPKSAPSAGRSLLSLLGLGKASIRRRI